MFNENLGQPLPKDRVRNALEGGRQVRDSAGGAFPVRLFRDILRNPGGKGRKHPDREPQVPDDAPPSDAGQRLHYERLHEREFLHPGGRIDGNVENSPGETAGKGVPGDLGTHRLGPPVDDFLLVEPARDSARIDHAADNLADGLKPSLLRGQGRAPFEVFQS